MSDPAIKVTMSIDRVEAGTEWLAEEPYRGEMVQRLEAWIGEFGRAEVGTAFAFAIVVNESRKRGLYPKHLAR